MARRRKRTTRTPAPVLTVAPEPQPVAFRAADFAVAGAVAVLTAAVYGATAARDIILGDTPELMTAAVTLGVAHPPGYPLLTMLGHLFSLLPFGALPFRVNLLAVVCGVAAVVFVYFTALRLTGNRAASSCAALVLAFSPLIWSWSLVTEVFPLNNALAAAMIYSLVSWYGQPERTGFLVAASFLGGLGLANQQTIVLLGPAALLVLWSRRKQLLARPLVLAISAAALLLGLLPYAYLAWAAGRHPLMNWGDPSSLMNLFAVITRKHYGTATATPDPTYRGGSAFDRLLALGASFGVLAGLLSLAGFVMAWRRLRWYFWFSLIALLLTGPFFAAYASVNISVGLAKFMFERFFLLAQVAAAPLMAFGVLGVAAALGRVVSRLRPYAVTVVSCAALLIVLWGVVANYRDVDLSRDHLARQFAEDIFTSLPRGSILLLNGDEVIMPLTYLQQAERYRPDVALIAFPFLFTDWYLPQLRRQYPDLAIPFQRYDGRSGTIRALLEANPGRRLAVDGVVSESSLAPHYWYHQHGLVNLIEPISKDVGIDELISETRNLLQRYRPPSPSAIKSNSLEPSLLAHYATPSYVVAKECREVHDTKCAIEWYQRTLEQEPALTDVRDVLRQLREGR